MKIKFLATGLDVKVPATDNTKFCELVEKLFEMRGVNYEENKTKVLYEIALTNKTLEWNSKSTVKELGLKNNAIIYLKGLTKVIAPTVERKANRFKTNVVAENEKNIPEKFPDILGEMAAFSEECLGDILEKNSDGDNEYKKYDYALGQKMRDRHIFLFGLIGKYLVDVLGIDVYIDLNDGKTFDKEERLKGFKTFRYLSNGFLTKTKSTISLTPNINKDLNNDKIRKEINDKFKKKLMQEYTKLNDKNFVVTSVPNSGKLKFLLIQAKEGEIELEQTKVQKSSNIGFFKNEEPEIEEELPLMEAIILNKSFLLPQFDSNDDKGFGINEQRGKEKYYPPFGWWRFGVLAYDHYGNDNDWLSYDNKSWCVAYVGLRKPEIEELIKKFENDEDVRHPGKKVGLGVAVCQNPKDMEEDCAEIEVGNEVYKIGFMLRIKPDAIRIPKSGNNKYWVVDGTKEDLRPYSILSKRISP